MSEPCTLIIDRYWIEACLENLALRSPPMDTPLARALGCEGPSGVRALLSAGNWLASAGNVLASSGNAFLNAANALANVANGSRT